MSPFTRHVFKSIKKGLKSVITDGDMISKVRTLIVVTG